VIFEFWLGFVRSMENERSAHFSLRKKGVATPPSPVPRDDGTTVERLEENRYGSHSDTITIAKFKYNLYVITIGRAYESTG